MGPKMDTSTVDITIGLQCVAAYQAQVRDRQTGTHGTDTVEEQLTCQLLLTLVPCCFSSHTIGY